jgi:hypothetical protein
MLICHAHNICVTGRNVVSAHLLSVHFAQSHVSLNCRIELHRHTKATGHHVVKFHYNNHICVTSHADYSSQFGLDRE